MFGPHFYAPHFTAQQQQQPRRYRQEQPNFQGLFRLIDDWDRYAQQANANQGRCQRKVVKQQTFTPKFDVHETENSYELHGELPGMDKENVHIEFVDPQTLQIRGRIERSYTAGTPPAEANLIDAAKNNDKEDIDMINGAILPQQTEEDDEPVVIDGHDEAASETSSNKSFQATVEDEAEEGATTTTTATATAIPTPATTNAEITKPAAASEVTRKEEPQQQQPGPKFWLSERSIGQFARNFTFPSRVDTDAVSASLHDGVLAVKVPKARKHESRRIAIL